MKHSRFSKFMLVADLTLCCIWLMCLINGASNGMWVYSSLWIMPLMRMWLSFLIYRRSRMALAPLSVLTLATISLLAGRARLAFPVYVDPLLTLLRAVPPLFGEHVITSGTMSDIWLRSADHKVFIGLIVSVWVIMIPWAIFMFRCFRKENVKSPFTLRKRIGLCAAVTAIVFIESFVVAHFYYSHVSVLVLCLLLMLMPVIFNGGKLEGMLSKGEQAFILILLLLGSAYTSGINYSQASIVTTIALPAAFFAIFSWIMDCKIRYNDVVTMISASVLFEFSQYHIGMFRILMLLISLGMMAVPIIRLAVSTRRVWTAAAVYVATAVLLPVFCIGYNPYSVLDAGRVGPFDGYEYSRNGLMLVKGKDGMGIRDRYELILPAEYEDVELLISHKPYCKVETVDGWKIYDIVRQELLTEEVFTEVIPYGKFTFLLKSEEGDKYLIIPLTYSRFNDSKVAVISSHLE